MSQDLKESRLFQALCGKSVPVVPELPPVTIRPLASMLRDLMRVDDISWGRYTFAREPLNGKFTDVDRERLTLGAMECGRQYADKMLQTYGVKEPRKLSKKLEVIVEYPDMPASLIRVLFAEYKPKKQIYIYMDSVNKAMEILKNDSEIRALFGAEFNIQRILLGHELFHHIEELYSKQIYTRTEKVELWAPPLFRNRSSIACLGEIAAMEFSRQLNEITFSPYLMDVFLVYGYSKEHACRIFEEIMDIAGLIPEGGY